MGLRERLIELRKRLGLSKADFAARIGVSAAYIHILESGKQEITLRVLESISRSFEIPLSYFFEDLSFEEDIKLELKKAKVNYLINEKKEILEGDFGEIYVPKKLISNRDLLVKYNSLDIPLMNIKMGDYLICSYENELNNQDRLVVKIRNKVKLCILNVKRGNYILSPCEENDFSFILDENKMDILKIKKILTIEE